MSQSAIYLVAQGDTLTSIARHYNPAADARQLQQAIDQIAATNRLANPDRIRAGQVLEIEVDAPAGRKAPGPTLVMPQGIPDIQLAPTALAQAPDGPSPVTEQISRKLDGASPQQKLIMTSLAPYILGLNGAINGASVGLDGIDRTLAMNKQTLRAIVDAYTRYQAGALSREAFYALRRAKIDCLRANLGPLGRLIHGPRTNLYEILRFNTRTGAAPAADMLRHIDTWERISKLATRGNVILTTVSLGLTCVDMRQQSVIKTKNEILVESLGALLAGSMAGIVLTAVLAPTPLGWVAALVIGLGVLAAGIGGGLMVRSGYDALYDRYGAKVDLAHLTRLDLAC